MKLSFTFGKRALKRTTSHVPFTFMRPEREWLIGLCLAGTLFGCGSAYAGLLFFNELNASGANTLEVPESTAYRHTLVRSTLTKYQERTSNFAAKRAEKLASSVPGVLLVEEEAMAATSTATSTVSVEEGGVETE